MLDVDGLVEEMRGAGIPRAHRLLRDAGLPESLASDVVYLLSGYGTITEDTDSIRRILEGVEFRLRISDRMSRLRGKLRESSGACRGCELSLTEVEDLLSWFRMTL